MGIILDVIILGIFILSVFMGYKKGLINVVFNFCAFIVAIIITVILYNPITNFVINNTEIDDNLKSTIIEKGIIEKKETKEDDSVNGYVQKYVSDAVTDAANTSIEATAGIVAEKVVAIGVAIILFIVVRIGLILLKFVANGIAELPIIKQFNEIGGILYGVLRGVLVIYILLAILFFIASVNGAETITSFVNSSFITKILYSNNIILNILF